MTKISQNKDMLAVLQLKIDQINVQNTGQNDIVLSP